MSSSRFHNVELINNKILQCKCCPIVYVSERFYVHPSITSVYLCKRKNHDMQHCHLDGNEILYCKHCFLIFDLESKEFKHYKVENVNVELKEFKCYDNKKSIENENEDKNKEWISNNLFNKKIKFSTTHSTNPLYSE